MDPAGNKGANGCDRESDSKQSKSEITRLSPLLQTPSIEERQVTPAGDDGTMNSPRSIPHICSKKSQARITGTIAKDITEALEQLSLSSSFTTDCIERTEMGLNIIEERLAEIEKITLEEVSSKTKRPWPTSSLAETRASADDNVKELTNTRTTGTKPKDTRSQNMEGSICPSKEDLTQQHYDDPAKSTEENTPSTSQVAFPAGWFHQNLLSQPLTSWPTGSSANTASTASAPSQVTNKVETDMMSYVQNMLASQEQVVSSSTDDSLSETSDRSKIDGHNHSLPRKRKVKERRIKNQKKDMPQDRLADVEQNLRSSLMNRQRKPKGSQAKSVHFSVPKQYGPRNKDKYNQEEHYHGGRILVEHKRTEQLNLQKPESSNSSKSPSSESSNEPGSSTESISEYITQQRVPIQEETNPHSQPRTRREFRSIRRERSHQGQRKRGTGRGERQLTQDEHWPRLPRSNHRMRYPTRYIPPGRGREGQENKPSADQ